MIETTQNSKKGNTITFEQIETLCVLSMYNVLPEINVIDLRYEPLYFLCEKETIICVIVMRDFNGTKTWIEDVPAQDYCNMIGLYSDGKFSSAYLNNLLKEKKKLLYLNEITEHQNEIASTVEKIRQLSGYTYTEKEYIPTIDSAAVRKTMKKMSEGIKILDMLNRWLEDE